MPQNENPSGAGKSANRACNESWAESFHFEENETTFYPQSDKFERECWGCLVMSRSRVQIISYNLSFKIVNHFRSIVRRTLSWQQCRASILESILLQKLKIYTGEQDFASSFTHHSATFGKPNRKSKLVDSRETVVEDTDQVGWDSLSVWLAGWL